MEFCMAPPFARLARALWRGSHQTATVGATLPPRHPRRSAASLLCRQTQRAVDRFGFAFDDAQKRARRAVWLTPALLPLAHRGNGKPKTIRKFGLRKPEPL